ncbi:MAG: hypothetical protein IAE80_08715, partial [Anaerolinea sp.]|nr:hypothetical protein [Anaerolinea sp.]
GGGAVGASTIPLAGAGVYTGATVPYDVQALVSAYQLTGVDAVGDIPYPAFAETDIQYVGVASNFDQPGGNTGGNVNGNTLVTFGLAMAQDWDTLNELSFRIYVDTLGNGFGTQVDNFVSFSQSTTSNNTQGDLFYNFWRYSGSSSGFSHGQPNWFAPNQVTTYLYHNNVIALPMLPGASASYGGGNTTILKSGDTDFFFYVETFHRSWGVVDVSPVMYYNLAHPVIDTVPDAGTVNSLPAWLDGAGFAPTFDYDLSGWQAGDPRPQLLLLHHHNQPVVQNADGMTFRRAETVRLDFESADLELSLSASPYDPYFVLSHHIPVDYTVTNNGADWANPEVGFTLPATTTFISASPNCTHSGGVTGGTVTCVAAELLAPGASTGGQIEIRVDNTVVGLFTVGGSVWDAGNLVDPDWSNNDAEVTVPVPPTMPTPTAPLGTVFTGNPTFEWNNVLGGQWYELRVVEITDSLTWVDIFLQSYEGSVICAGANCAVTPSLNLPTGNYLFQVRAWHADGGYSLWSNVAYFSNGSPTPTPVLIAPSGTTTNTNPAFHWGDVPGADSYYVWVDKVAGPGAGTHVADVWVNDAAVCDGFDCFADLGLSLTPGYYTFWVQAWSNTGGYSLWSLGMDFALAATPMTPVPVSPSGSVGTNAPAFTFTVDPVSEWHYLWVVGEDGHVWDQWYLDSSICDSSNTCTVSLPFTLNTGYYTWWVQSWTSIGGYSAWSSDTVFAVALPPLAPTQVAPVGNMTPGSVPSFIFNPVPGADWYYIWVSGPSGHVLDQWFQDSICAGSFCTASPGVAMNTVGTYTWWVQAW